MEILKTGKELDIKPLTDEELLLINSFAKVKLSSEDVYAFSIKLCDNEVDRDFERFTEQALNELATLYVGKSGIFDHKWSAGGQAARIYKTELVKDDERKTTNSLPYTYLKAYAYMVKTDSNRDLIKEIDAGIKKEVSVGCSLSESICSICNKNTLDEGCAHKKGRYYEINGEKKLCFYELKGAVDAYEWSFVAVPAQREAGVLKTAKSNNLKYFLPKSIDEFVKMATEEGLSNIGKEHKRLCEQAKAGELYEEHLKAEIKRLLCLCANQREKDFFNEIAHNLTINQLNDYFLAIEERYAKKFAPQSQIQEQNTNKNINHENFKI